MKKVRDKKWEQIISQASLLKNEIRARITLKGQGETFMNEKKINKHIFVWIGNFLVGHFGVDRFMRGQIGMGIFKLLCNWMTFGIWSLTDWIISLVKAYSAYSDTDDITFIDGKYSR